MISSTKSTVFIYKSYTVISWLWSSLYKRWISSLFLPAHIIVEFRCHDVTLLHLYKLHLCQYTVSYTLYKVNTLIGERNILVCTEVEIPKCSLKWSFKERVEDVSWINFPVVSSCQDGDICGFQKRLRTSLVEGFLACQKDCTPWS